MSPIIRNILSIVLGLILGAALNMAIVMLSGHIIPPPAGVNLSTDEGLKAAMPLMQPKHFIMPFLAHALGTLLAAFIATVMAASRTIWPAIAVGTLFLIGGIMAVIMYGGPSWFKITDIVGAYLPMAFIGWKIGNRTKTKSVSG